MGRDTQAKNRAVGYVRVSRVGGRGGDRFLSPDLQREEIGRVAARKGLEIVEVIEELDASGGDSTRPGWNRALEMVRDGEDRAGLQLARANSPGSSSDSRQAFRDRLRLDMERGRGDAVGLSGRR